MEHYPEHLPPDHRPGPSPGRERVYTFNYSVKQVHPLVGLLISLAGLAIFIALLVFFFWFAIIALAVGAIAFILRTLISAFRT